MESNLFTLSKIFTERLFRIPDYQRGYAWTELQWKDFWNDILQIEEHENHYTGVLTLEAVPQNIVSTWYDDSWIIESKGYEPFYVVDGQQRLTTAIILIQTIIEAIPSDSSINYTEPNEIKKKFIFESKDSGISRSYIFGYEKDNPSYDFLKTKIFGEFSSSARTEETIYTNNLELAKEYFSERISSLSFSELESIYRRVTQSLLFNIFLISNEVDVCVAFETINNRGKPLSDLEKLKNRLIYLSLKFDEGQFEKDKLRRSINDCWKAIYHSLGRNKHRPLDDDIFLGSHYILYFSKVYQKIEEDESDFKEYLYIRQLQRGRKEYSKLLDNIFVPRRVIGEETGSSELTVGHVYDYVSSLQASVEYWYDIFNPLEGSKLGEGGIWLDKLDRIGNRSYLPLILSILLRVPNNADRVQILERLENYIFLESLVDYATFRGRYTAGFLKEAVDLYNGKISAKQLSARISDTSSQLLSANDKQIRTSFKSRGYYGWSLVRYFLYEYNLHLQSKSKTERKKIDWSELNERRPDYTTVEHIYPQKAQSGYWRERFSGYSPRQRETLKNSLGNLLPLSQPKNSSLSNKPFPDKVDGKEGSTVGYRFGSYAENEVAKEDDWTPARIRDRGEKLLKFMEKRWSFPVGDEKSRREMLGLDFLE